MLGTPSDSSVADALAQAAQDIAQGLPGHSNEITPRASGSLQALLKAVLWGFASLTQAQLHAAANHILRLAGQSGDEAAVDELSQQIPYVLHRSIVHTLRQKNKCRNWHA